MVSDKLVFSHSWNDTPNKTNKSFQEISKCEYSLPQDDGGFTDHRLDLLVFKLQIVSLLILQIVLCLGEIRVDSQLRIQIDSYELKF